MLKNSGISALASMVTSCITEYVGICVDMAQEKGGYNSWTSGKGMADVTSGFGDFISTFYGVIDDVISYIVVTGK